MTDEQWHSTLKIYRDAERLPEENRAPFLSSNSNDPVVVQTLQALLKPTTKAPRAPSGILPGRRVGHYVVIREIGRGGMGEVYAARDARLDRMVALKFLFGDEIGNASGVERFLREAQAASKLNHPNIVTVYDVIDDAGATVLVMELVQGKPLREWCGSANPLWQILQFGQDVARALAAVHAQGLIHRDMKPENVIVREDGCAKLTDFGLARTLSAGELTLSGGLHAGTLRYMSPEQANGEAVTTASDVFSFGILLYELSEGKHPFAAEFPIETAHAIATSNAPPLRAQVPPELRRLIGAMLARRPALRPSAQEVAANLAKLAEFSERPAMPSWKRPGSLFGRSWGWLLVALLMLAPLVWFFKATLPGAHRSQQGRFQAQIALGPAVFLDNDGIALSPDGGTLIFRGSGQLRIQNLDGSSSVVVSGGETGKYPFWSSDGTRIGFYRNGRLWRKKIPDGTPEAICEAPDPVSASWSNRETIIFSGGPGKGIYKVPSSGGNPVPVTQLRNDLGETMHSLPYFLPGGTRFLHLRSTGEEKGTIAIGSIDTPGKIEPLLRASVGALYTSSTGGGRIIYVQDGTLFSQNFNAATGDLRGPPLILANYVRYSSTVPFIGAATAREGSLVYAEEDTKLNQPKLFDRTGNPLGVLGPPAEYIRVTPSPNSRAVMLVRQNRDDQRRFLEILDRETGALVPVTEGFKNPSGEVWMPDAAGFLVNEVHDSSIRFRLCHWPLGSKPVTTIQTIPGDGWLMDVSPDARVLLYAHVASSSRYEIRALRLDHPESEIPITTEAGKNTEAKFSPGAKLISYQSDESGQTEIYIQPFPPDGRKWKVTSGGGQEARWSPDGRELMFLSLDYALMSMPIYADDKGVRTGPPKRLFGGRRAEPSLTIWHFEPVNSGREVLVLTRSPQVSASPLHVLLNW